MKYRAFVVNSQGLTLKIEAIDARDDFEAIDAAKQICDGEHYEIWCGERLVQTAQPKWQKRA